MCDCENRLRNWLETSPAVVHLSEEDVGACVDSLLRDVDMYDDDDWGYDNIQFSVMTAVYDLFGMLSDCGEGSMDEYRAVRTQMMRWTHILNTLLTEGIYEHVNNTRSHRISQPISMPPTPRRAPRGGASWADPRT